MQDKSALLDVMNMLFLYAYREVDFCLSLQKFVILHDVQERVHEMVQMSQDLNQSLHL
jgi:hypothetical protein